MKLLLTTTIDKDHVNNLGWTALMEAVVLGDGGPAHTEIVRLLVAAGANTSIPDRDRITPLEHAKQRGYAEMVKILSVAARVAPSWRRYAAPLSLERVETTAKRRNSCPGGRSPALRPLLLRRSAGAQRAVPA